MLSSVSGAQVVLSSGLRPSVAVTASRNLTAADLGQDLVNAGATANVVLAVPPGLPLGSTIEISQTALFDIGVSLSGGESINIGTTAGATTLTAKSNTNTTMGSTFFIKKETASVWFLKWFEGSVG